MAQWCGYLVSIQCSDSNTYQGEIIAATPSVLTLTKVFCNGFPCKESEVKISSENILDLKLIEKQKDTVEEKSVVTIAKPIARRGAPRQHHPSESSYNTSGKSSNSGHGRTKPIDVDAKPAYNRSKLSDVEAKPSSFNRSKPIDIEQKSSIYNRSKTIDIESKSADSLNNSFKNNTPNRKEKNSKRYQKGWKDEECFGSPLDQSNISKDFDFEKNLALFNKQAIWDEINAQKPDVIKYNDNRKASSYRHDENIIATVSTTCRQITVPKQDFCEYVTDDGLIIPSISRNLRKKLWEVSERVGLTWEKRIDLFGRCAADFAIQLLGGGHRLNPKNTHQFPTVVVLCGPHKQGAAGINTARMLASHGIETIVFTISTDAPLIKKEFALYKLTKNKVLNNAADLPRFVDLIILALCEDTDNPKHYPLLSDWVNKNRATVVALDPPPVGTPGITPKFSLIPVLPLPHSSNNGKLYLCNLGFPVDVFNEVGIKYRPPFGPKFVIPLHPKED